MNLYSNMLLPHCIRRDLNLLNAFTCSPLTCTLSLLPCSTSLHKPHRHHRTHEFNTLQNQLKVITRILDKRKACTWHSSGFGNVRDEHPSPTAIAPQLHKPGWCWTSANLTLPPPEIASGFYRSS